MDHTSELTFDARGLLRNEARLEADLRRRRPDLFDPEGRLCPDRYAREALKLTGGKRWLSGFGRHLAYKWAKFTHPHKSKHWIITRYFGAFNSASTTAAFCDT